MARGKRVSKSQARKNQSNYVISRTDNIGTGDADTDAIFHENCFVDTGVLKILQDTQDPRRIVLARTGSGKTALLKRLEDEQSNVIRLAPETLALSHISNSQIIRFYEKQEAHLDPFYTFLWVHVIAVELLKQK